MSSEFRGAACNSCNLALKPRKGKSKFSGYFIPIFLHNASNYDFKLIVKYFSNRFASKEISVIASNTEKFIGFQIGNLRFLDSFKFLGTSLDALTQNLLKSGEDKFQITRNAFPGSSTVFRKGIYPYEYMDSYSRFSETQLPPQHAFYSQLNDSHITDEDYQMAQAAWVEFKCQTMQNYHDFYLKLDVALLADVFENFRSISQSAYGLDPAHYWTLPGFSWDACLKETGVKLELFTEPDANK